jgi:hypothetical protein
VEAILQKFIAGGYSQLILAVATVGSFLLGVSPIGTFFKKRFYLPYWFAKLLHRQGFVSPLTKSCEDKNLAAQIDRRLYVLNGNYRKMGICSHKPNSIGTLDQFNHTGKLENPGIDSLFVKRFSNLGEENDLTVEEILSFWQPHIIGNVDSIIIEVIQTSILCRLGFMVPFSQKLKCQEWIRIYFLKQYLLEGKINSKILLKVITAEGYLIQRGKQLNKYKIERNQFLSIFINDERKNLESESVATLLRNSNNAFDEFANIKNKEV